MAVAPAKANDQSKPPVFFEHKEHFNILNTIVNGGKVDERRLKVYEQTVSNAWSGEGEDLNMVLGLPPLEVWRLQNQQARPYAWKSY